MKGRIVHCSGHGGQPCARVVKVVGRVPDGFTYDCGEAKPYVPRGGRVGQQKGKR